MFVGLISLGRRVTEVSPQIIVKHIFRKGRGGLVWGIVW